MANQTIAGGRVLVDLGADGRAERMIAHPDPATATLSNVADQATNVTLLAANAARKGASIYNDSPSNLYVKLGATASAISFTVLLLGNATGVGGFYEVPPGYIGQIDGLWSADSTGSARVTELS